jgi:hypothetical protein
MRLAPALPLLVVVALVALTGPVCAPPAAPDGPAVAYLELPRGAGATGPAWREPAPPGGRLMLWRPGGEPRALTDAWLAVSLCDVSPDATRVLFAGRRSQDDPWRIYELSLRGGRPTPVSPEGAAATSAAYLPHGRCVFACDADGAPDPLDGRPAFSLYTARLDGTERSRITFNPFSDVQPTVLDDGRILYSAWQPPGEGRPQGGWALLTVLDDGTGLLPFYGSHQPQDEPHRARPLGELLVFDAGDGLAAVALGRPLHSRRALLSSAVDAVDRWDGSGLLVSQRTPDAEDGYGLYRIDPATGSPRVLHDDASTDELGARLVAPRAPPKGHLSLVDPGEATGELLCLDARLTDRDAALASGADRLQVLAGRPGEPARHASPPIAPWELATDVIADVPLADDGSAWLTVPADTPLRFRTLDDDGRVLLDSQGWAWVRPKEKRSCIGCHEDRETAPANRLPAALAHGPHALPETRVLAELK